MSFTARFFFLDWSGVDFCDVTWIGNTHVGTTTTIDLGGGGGDDDDDSGCCGC